MRLQESTQRPQLNHSHTHLPIDNIYDATPSPANVRPRRSPEVEASPASLPGAASPSRDLVQDQKTRNQKSQPRQAGCAGAQQAKRDVAIDVGNPPSEATKATNTLTQGDKRKKPKQRPKPPLQFDEISQQLMEPQARPKIKPQTRSKAKAPQRPRMPIVSALRDSAQPSSPQATVPRKRGAGKCSQPKKKAKTAEAKEQQQTSLVDTSKQHPDPGKSSAPFKQQATRAKQIAKPPKASPRPKPDLPIPVKSPDPIVLSSDNDSDSDSVSALRGVRCRSIAKRRAETQMSLRGLETQSQTNRAHPSSLLGNNTHNQQRETLRAGDQIGYSIGGASATELVTWKPIDWFITETHLQDNGTHSDEHLRRHDATNSSTKDCRDEVENLQAGPRSNPSDNLPQRLHQLVDAMVKQLRSKEEAGHNIADVYRTKTAGCIDKIGNRQSQERKVLLETLAVDAAKFRDVVQQAKSTVSNDSRLREPDIREFERDTAERLAMYERATKSLQALHRQLLEGGGISG
ncbi:hypothetical protein HRG_005318 [Hirsutella rhossiliensis]|uniref:Uncharacterized protein n=1 Tax=Hirsutella rhossiliensis TaxID=111463 RepID=A0A9P8SH75_9HYPO|nr:uncharacterized protein HRG_05318 [Hirsutella rhossiliensis]KAH0962808.1 hypothetical protein HRG_05318 [Hirsutella rhossiliensis]